MQGYELLMPLHEILFRLLIPVVAILVALCSVRAAVLHDEYMRNSWFGVDFDDPNFDEIFNAKKPPTKKDIERWERRRREALISERAE